jgi:GNAT superfamily N-acetyltransferase
MLRQDFPMAKASNAPKIKVRPAMARDIAEIARLAGELGYPSTAAQVRDRLAVMRGNSHQATFVAALAGGDVIGWIHLSEEHSPGSDPRAEISNLVVDSRFRGAGTGRLLVERGERWAREQGLAAMGVRSNIIREGSHAFYLRLGYTITKFQKVFRKTL